MGVAATSRGSVRPPAGALPLYRPRAPRHSPLYQLLDTHYERVKGLWDERFERRYGFWRGRWDTAVARFLDCGLFEHGFARVVCPSCRAELLVAFSCKGRGLCPSCGAKRAALFAELLQQEVLADVPHAQWVFSMPKMLRPYFLYHRELLGELSRVAFHTVRELMAEATDEPRARPGMVAVIQTFGSSLRWNPHIHAVVSRGVWGPDGRWHPVPYVDAHAAELLFRHKLLRLLRDRELLSEERIDLLLSWRHSGFSVHNHTTVYPSDAEGLHPGAPKPPPPLFELRRTSLAKAASSRVISCGPPSTSPDSDSTPPRDGSSTSPRPATTSMPPSSPTPSSFSRGSSFTCPSPASTSSASTAPTPTAAAPRYETPTLPKPRSRPLRPDAVSTSGGPSSSTASTRSTLSPAPGAATP